MKPRFILEDYIDDNVEFVMRCRTKKEAEIFCNYLHSKGRAWYNGESYLEKTNWENYRENTYYRFKTGTFGYISSASSVCSTSVILEFSDFDWEEIKMEKTFDIEKLEFGMVVVFKDKKDGIGFVVDKVKADAGLVITHKLKDRGVVSLLYNLNPKRDFNIIGRYEIEEVYEPSNANALRNLICNKEDLIFKKNKERKLFAGKDPSELHKEMWNWLADNPHLDKKDWVNLQSFPRQEREKLENNNHCFACWAIDRGAKKYSIDSCDGCPICVNGENGINCLNGLYQQWRESAGYKKATIAKEIANLEWIEK